MTTHQNLLIDPALAALDGRQVKGKGRAKPELTPRRPARTSLISSTNATSTSPSASTARGVRKAANMTADPAGEPSRGEEENLIGYDFDRESKRARLHSPLRDPSVYASTSQGNAPRPASNRESAKAVKAVSDASPPPRMPYPFGLTPFRYACLTPDHPQPPPGDPHNPNFHPFDPNEILTPPRPRSKSLAKEIPKAPHHPSVLDSSTDVAGLSNKPPRDPPVPEQPVVAYPASEGSDLTPLASPKAEEFPINRPAADQEESEEDEIIVAPITPDKTKPVPRPKRRAR